MAEKKYFISNYDLPEKVLKMHIETISIDTETTGLYLKRDRLCVVQIMINEAIYLVCFPTPKYDAPVLKALLSDGKILKIFHYARFDVLAIYLYLNIMVENSVCTKILSKIARTYSDRHSLRELCRELLGVELNKSSQTSYWGADELSQSQIAYAAKDVEYLEKLYKNLVNIATREGRMHVAEQLFKSLPALTLAEAAGYDPLIVLSH